jgi:hypothetical protein
MNDGIVLFDNTNYWVTDDQYFDENYFLSNIANGLGPEISLEKQDNQIAIYQQPIEEETFIDKVETFVQNPIQVFLNLYQALINDEIQETLNTIFSKVDLDLILRFYLLTFENIRRALLVNEKIFKEASIIWYQDLNLIQDILKTNALYTLELMSLFNKLRMLGSTVDKIAKKSSKLLEIQKDEWREHISQIEKFEYEILSIQADIKKLKNTNIDLLNKQLSGLQGFSKSSTNKEIVFTNQDYQLQIKSMR